MVTMLVVGFSSEQILDSSVLSLHKQIHPINVTSSVIALFTLFSISILSFIFYFFPVSSLWGYHRVTEYPKSEGTNKDH